MPGLLADSRTADRRPCDLGCLDGDGPPLLYSTLLLLLLLLLRPWSPGRATVGFLLEYPLLAFRSSSTSCVRSHLIWGAVAEAEMPWLFPVIFYLFIENKE